VVNGSEWLRETPNNLAIEILTTLLGPMKGAYTGPYPSRGEAIQAVKTSKLQFLPGEFSRDASELGLPSGEPLESLERQLERFLDKDLPIGAAVYRDETIILGREKCVYLVERRTAKIYARYVFRYSAWMLLADGEVDKAIAGLDHAVEVDPRNPEYLQERGDAYAAKGDAARAAADYRKALEVAPAAWYRRTDVERKATKMKPTGS
jgi:tetratricopeptide (TPR) repeat protein